VSRDRDFEELVARALDTLPPQLREAISNVEIVVEDEPPPEEGDDVLGLYEGIPLTERDTSYGFVPPDKITLFRGPLERLTRNDPALLAAEVRQTVLHELAHHFGISDERLTELDRY